MTAAGRAAELGARTLLLEKNSVLGKKLLLTGGGRCNVTNATTDRHILTGRYGKRGVFLHSLFARFGPDDTRELLRRFGLETKIEAEGRVFPVTESAASVRDVLERYMAETGVVVRRGQSVSELITRDDLREETSGETTIGREPESGRNEVGRPGHARSTESAEPASSTAFAKPAPNAATQPAPIVAGVRTSRGESIYGSTIVLATGGTARPETGSTGDALPWFESLGVEVRRADTALVPLRVPDRWVTSLQGLALPNAEIAVEIQDGKPSTASADERRGTSASPSERLVSDHRAWANARRVYSQRGKLLFTHFGISGPVALNSARDIREIADAHAEIRLLINPLPGTDPTTIDQRIREAVDQRGKQSVSTLLKTLVPPRLAAAISTVSEVPPDQRLATLSKMQRRRIVQTVIGLPCRFGGLMGSDKAVVSSGGIAPEAIDFRTMSLHAIPNLFVLGDLIDFNRRSGGYSLQVCWSSGWVAAEAAVARSKTGNGNTGRRGPV